eukprot:gnl/MRDRNA2_/MRDRNA2_33493_c0_seq1.p1 gnl/MRDRNA2_/MRDRNA2_33493_c0~~gnl/MRDRNA2_/MRDRNA2_33493_c0_seq1.p1  ORF type:complete len:594 (-),score=104.58 gnl/MRDRNA2_/MRDRNA2_33493_c0_seq1:154-1935(-)
MFGPLEFFDEPVYLKTDPCDYSLDGCHNGRVANTMRGMQGTFDVNEVRDFRPQGSSSREPMYACTGNNVNENTNYTSFQTSFSNCGMNKAFYQHRDPVASDQQLATERLYFESNKADLNWMKKALHQHLERQASEHQPLQPASDCMYQELDILRSGQLPQARPQYLPHHEYGGNSAQSTRPQNTNQIRNDLEELYWQYKKLEKAAQQRAFAVENPDVSAPWSQHVPSSTLRAVGTRKADVGGQPLGNPRLPYAHASMQFSSVSAAQTDSQMMLPPGLSPPLSPQGPEAYPRSFDSYSQPEAADTVSWHPFAENGDSSRESIFFATEIGKGCAPVKDLTPLAANPLPSIDSKKQDNANAKTSGKNAKKNQGQTIPKTQGVTTLMVRHIPCRLSPQDLVELLDNSGFKDKFNFLHLPVAAPMARTFTSNLGYCFINFTKPEFAEQFHEQFAGKRLGVSLSSKECEITHAHVQGFEANLRHFSRATRSKSYNIKPYIKTDAQETDHTKTETNSDSWDSSDTNSSIAQATDPQPAAREQRTISAKNFVSGSTTSTASCVSACATLTECLSQYSEEAESHDQLDASFAGFSNSALRCL